MAKYNPKKNFVTNVNPEEIDTTQYLHISKSLGIPAWFDRSINGLPGSIGFYVHYKVKDLTEFWETIEAHQHCKAA